MLVSSRDKVSWRAKNLNSSKNCWYRREKQLGRARAERQLRVRSFSALKTGMRSVKAKSLYATIKALGIFVTPLLLISGRRLNLLTQDSPCDWYKLKGKRKATRQNYHLGVTQSHKGNHCGPTSKKYTQSRWTHSLVLGIDPETEAAFFRFVMNLFF